MLKVLQERTPPSQACLLLLHGNTNHQLWDFLMITSNIILLVVAAIIGKYKSPII